MTITKPLSIHVDCPSITTTLTVPEPLDQCGREFMEHLLEVVHDASAGPHIQIFFAPAARIGATGLPTLRLACAHSVKSGKQLVLGRLPNHIDLPTWVALKLLFPDVYSAEALSRALFR